jgi:hypothetical protein
MLSNFHIAGMQTYAVKIWLLAAKASNLIFNILCSATHNLSSMTRKTVEFMRKSIKIKIVCTVCAKYTGSKIPGGPIFNHQDKLRQEYITLSYGRKMISKCLKRLQ